MNHKLAVIFGVLFLTFATSAHANKNTIWKNVGTWIVGVDQSLGNGCFVSAVTNRGTAFRFGFSFREKGGIFVLIGNKDWASIEEGKDYKMVLQFDRRPAWTWRPAGVPMESGKVYLYGLAMEADFFNEMAKSHVMSVTYQGRHVAQLNLKGSHAALMELANCQQAMNATGTTGRRISKDPFATDQSRRSKKDPFAN